MSHPASVPEAPTPFPIFLGLVGAAVLVVGGGEMASAKARLLIGTGARITVVDPAPEAELAALAEAGQLALRRRAFAPADLDGARLCYVALDSAEAAAAVVAEARARGVLVNAVDRPALCDFATPAIVRRGPVAIAVGTGGLAPALARDLRARIEAAVPPAFGALAALCARWRDRAARALRDRDRRRRFWDAVLDGPESAAALRGDAPEAERRIAERLAAAAAGTAPPVGRVSLVGAGPGDAGHLTLAALRALQRADVILYDKLVGPDVLELARRDARRVDVGKRAGRHSAIQGDINGLMIEYAQAGAHVVRLKGGDPLVFGRSEEELDALHAAGIPVEVIPGITTAFAVAAGLQMPFTRRGTVRSMHLLTAHDRSMGLPEHNWAALAASGGTLVFYMGVRTLPGLTARLLESGLDPATPALAVENATLPQERQVRGTLVTLPGLLEAAGVDGPTLVVVGAVVALARTNATEETARDAA